MLKSLGEVLRAPTDSWKAEGFQGIELAPDAPLLSAVMKVLVLAEEMAHGLAKDLVAELLVPDVEAALLILPRYPKGDGLPLLLHSISRRADLVLVCMSDSKESRFWMAKELALRHLYPSLTPVFPSSANVAGPWSDSADVLVHGSEPTLAFVRRHTAVR